MATEILYTEANPSPDQLYELFLSTGWNEEYGLTQEEFFHTLQHSWYCLSAYDKDVLVGFGRIISDTVLHALIVDMMILPDYQGKGIGTALLKRLVQHCHRHRIRDIQLFSAEGKAGFYLKNGFIRRRPDAPGMEWPLPAD